MLRYPRGRRWRQLPWLVATAALSLLLLGQGGRGSNLKRPETLENCAVVKVHDGDTLHVLCRQHADQPRKLKIRLHCIDAPELAQTPWGREARDHLRTLIGKGPITIRIVDKDEYRRSVAEIRKDGKNANLEMVKTGNAAVYWRHCNSLIYGLAEWKARSGNVGIWRHTGSHQSPWEYRH
ncbi:MAG: thermonuclease family protein [Gammaproteobacteria bacterium]